MGSGRIARPEAAKLAEELRALLDATMHDRRATAVGVAEDTGVNRQTIGRVLRGGVPDLNTAAALAEWCGRLLTLADPES